MSIASIGASPSLMTASIRDVTSNSPFTQSDTTTSASGAPSGIGRFASAIQSAFAGLGISFGAASTSDAAASTTSTGTTATATTDDAGDAVAAFMQSLFAALHGQSTGANPPPPPPDASAGDPATPVAATDAPNSTSSASSSTATSAASPGVGRGHHHHGGGHLESDLNSLISQLASSTDGTSTSAAADTTSTAASSTPSPTSSSALATLGTQFDALLSKSGVTPTGNDTLTTFLQSLASSLHGAPATGNVVSTTA